jgi:hypothetical protein
MVADVGATQDAYLQQSVEFPARFDGGTFLLEGGSKGVMGNASRPVTRLMLAALTVVLAACATGDFESSRSVSEAATSRGATLRDELVEALRRDRFTFEYADFDGGLSAEETLRRFREQYGYSHSGGAPTAYAVRVTASPSPGLAPGSLARIVHVPDVEDAFEGVALGPGQSESFDSPPADLLAFFDAATGRHLETTFIAPEG